MQVPVYNLAGETVKHIEISDRVFGVPANKSLIHQAMVRQLADARQGNASTKDRGEVSGSTRKLYRQKHTGESRAGSIKSPLRRGGGITFGPKPRSYRQEMPKKMRQAALRSTLSAKMADGELKVVENFGLTEPKTREMVKVLAALGVESSALIVTDVPEENLIKSARNLVGIETMPVNVINVVALLSHKMLLISEAAVRKAEQLWAGELAKQTA